MILIIASPVAMPLLKADTYPAAARLQPGATHGEANERSYPPRRIERSGPVGDRGVLQGSARARGGNGARRRARRRRVPDRWRRQSRPPEVQDRRGVARYGQGLRWHPPHWVLG